MAWITCVRYLRPIVNQIRYTPKNALGRWRILFGTLFAISVVAVSRDNATGQPAPSQLPSLKEAVRGLFEIGAGVNDHIAERPVNWGLLNAQFSYVTPENCMKPDAVQRAEGRFDFTLPDAFVSFAGSNGLKVCGHCLVWA
jgi:GH35 family endo-1,4-beta-xylanase